MEKKERFHCVVFTIGTDCQKYFGMYKGKPRFQNGGGGMLSLNLMDNIQPPWKNHIMDIMSQMIIIIKSCYNDINKFLKKMSFVINPNVV